MTGCTKVSPGCANCYAQAMAHRLQAMGSPKYANGFRVTVHDGAVEEPLRWTRPSSIFICSMSDLFHEDVPFRFIDRVIGTVARTRLHRYQMLTKRPGRMLEYFAHGVLPGNVWLGVTVEDAAAKQRIDALRRLRPSVRYISCEPLLGDLGRLDLTGIDWIIVGGETGARARPMEPAWVASILRQAESHGAAVFFKQWGTWGPDGVRRNRKANGHAVDGRIIRTMPGPA